MGKSPANSCHCCGRIELFKMATTIPTTDSTLSTADGTRYFWDVDTYKHLNSTCISKIIDVHLMGDILYVDNTDEIIALDPDTLAELWRYDLSDYADVNTWSRSGAKAFEFNGYFHLFVMKSIYTAFNWTSTETHLIIIDTDGALVDDINLNSLTGEDIVQSACVIQDKIAVLTRNPDYSGFHITEKNSVYIIADDYTVDFSNDFNQYAVITATESLYHKIFAHGDKLYFVAGDNRFSEPVSGVTTFREHTYTGSSITAGDGILCQRGDGYVTATYKTVISFEVSGTDAIIYAYVGYTDQTAYYTRTTGGVTAISQYIPIKFPLSDITAFEEVPARQGLDGSDLTIVPYDYVAVDGLPDTEPDIFGMTHPIFNPSITDNSLPNTPNIIYRIDGQYLLPYLQWLVLWDDATDEPVNGYTSHVKRTKVTYTDGCTPTVKQHRVYGTRAYVFIPSTEITSNLGLQSTVNFES